MKTKLFFLVSVLALFFTASDVADTAHCMRYATTLMSKSTSIGVRPPFHSDIGAKVHVVTVASGYAVYISRIEPTVDLCKSFALSMEKFYDGQNSGAFKEAVKELTLGLSHPTCIIYDSINDQYLLRFFSHNQFPSLSLFAGAGIHISDYDLSMYGRAQYLGGSYIRIPTSSMSSWYLGGHLKFMGLSESSNLVGWLGEDGVRDALLKTCENTLMNNRMLLKGMGAEVSGLVPANANTSSPAKVFYSTVFDYATDTANTTIKKVYGPDFVDVKIRK